MNLSSNNIIAGKQGLSTYFLIAGLIIFSAVLVFLSFNPVISPFLPLILIVIPFIYLMFRYPKVWLWTVAATSFMFFRADDIEITPADVLFGVLFIASVYIWLIWILMVKREKIVRNVTDWLLILFYTGMLFNIIVAMLNGIEFIGWFREFALYSNLLLYFPIKHYMKDRQDILIFLLLFAMSIVLSAADQLTKYREIALQEAQYAYQLGNSVRLNQTLFSASIFFGLIMSVLTKNLKIRIMLWVFTGINIAALVVSFSRSFWLFVLFGTILVFFYLTPKRRNILVLAIALIITGSTIAFFSIFAEKAALMTQILTKRILSSTQGTKDLSVQLRLAEYKEVIEKIEENPFFGNGLGCKYSFYDPNLHLTIRPLNTHNGYLFTLYRFGIPMALCFFVIIASFLLRAEHLARKHKDAFFKHLSIISMVTILMILVACLASNQFFSRDGGIVLAVVFALISNAELMQKKLTSAKPID